MANIKISQLTATTNNSIGSYLVINNSGETTTNKSQLEYVLGLTKGVGANSIKSNDFLTANGTIADTESSIVLGNGASAFTADEQIIIGKGAYGQSIGVIAIGTNARDQGTGRDYGIAIGYDAEIYQSGAIVIGKNAGAVTDAFAIGNTARAIATETIAIGNNSVVAGNLSTGIGGSVFSDKPKNTTIGYDAYSDGENSTAIGADHILGQTGGQSDYSHTFGYKNTISNGAQYSVVIGTEVTNQSNGTIAISNELVDLGDNSENSVFIMGTGHTVNTRIGRSGVFIGGYSHTFTDPGVGSFNYGGFQTTNSSTGENSGVFHSDTSSVVDYGRLAGVYGSRLSSISGNSGSSFSTWGSSVISTNESTIKNARFSNILGGSQNDLLEVGSSVIFAGDANLIKGEGGANLIGGSQQSTIDNNNNNTNVVNAIIGGNECNLFDTDQSGIFISNESGISGGSVNTIVGGARNKIISSPFNNDIIGSENCLISQADKSSIYNSIFCEISAARERVTFINSSGSTISAGDNQVGIGLFNRTPNVDNTTSVENIHYFRRISTEVQSMVTGTIFTGTTAVDWNLGGKAQITITGASNVEFTNVRDGASFLLKTTTNGGHTITWSSTGYTFKWKGGDSAPSNNKTDLWRFDVYGTEIYGEKIADFS